VESRQVVFFDIGDTLATAEIVGGRVHLNVFEQVPAILDRLAEQGALLARYHLEYASGR